MGSMKSARTATIEHRASAEGEDGLLEMAIASEAPYERWWGTEILRCDAASVDLTRLADGRHPLLLNHDTERQIGVVKRAWIGEDRMVRGAVKFSRSELGQEIKQDVEDDIRTLISVGYEIMDLEEVERAADGSYTVKRSLTAAQFETEMRALHGETFHRAGPAAARGQGAEPPVFVVTRWQPFEASVVPIPADVTVGIGRAGSPAAPAVPAIPPITPPEKTMSDLKTIDNGAEERARVAAIRDVAKAFAKYNVGDLALEYIGEQKSLAEFQGAVMARMQSSHTAGAVGSADGAIGLSEKEAQRYSFFRAINALSDPTGGGLATAGFELEVHRAMEKKLGRSAEKNRILVPYEVQTRSFDPRMDPRQKRDLTVGTSSAGGYLVGTQNTSFIEVARNRSVAMRMGATMLSGLTGNITIPKQTGAATAYWLANEGTAITESQQTLGQLALSPKNVGAYTEVSRQLTLQSSPSAEAMVMNDLAAVVGLAIDSGILSGSGSSGQPTGITNTGSIGSVTGTSLDYADILEFQTDVAGGNNLVNPGTAGYVTTAAVAALLMQRVKFSSTASPLWEGNIYDGAMGGFKAMSSGQVAAATMIYGDFSQVVLAEWGVLELEVNPYANFAAGIIGVRAIATVDVGVRYAGSFSVASSIT